MVNEGLRPIIIGGLGHDGIYGFTYGELILDKYPSILNKELIFKLKSFQPSYEYVKPAVKLIKEVGVHRKITLGKEVQTNWFLRYGVEGYLPKFTWSAFINFLRKELTINILPLGIRRIYLSKKSLVTSLGSELRYKYLVNTLPLPQFLRFIRAPTPLPSVGEFNYIPIYTVLIMTEGSLEGSVFKVTYHGGAASFHTVVSYSLKDILGCKEELTLNYVFSSFSSIGKIPSGIGERVLSDLKRFRLLDVSKITFLREYLIKYGLLMKISKDVEGMLLGLREYGVINVGRVAEWRDYSIEKLVDRVKKLVYELA